MPETEPWTIGRLLNWTTDYLKQRGVDNPRLDAEILLAHARGCERIKLYTDFDHEADQAIRDRFRELVRRRADGMPVAYLVGRREFYSMSFRVTPDVLIPRPETEFLVMKLVDAAKKQRTGTVDIADVGTGSGVIAICAAKHISNCRVTAIDSSEQALDVARENAQRHHVADKITFVHGDLLQCLDSSQRFHFVASNPPYVSTSEVAQLPRDVHDYEPHAALSAGPLGTDIIERLIPQAAERLHAQSQLLMEISPQIEPRVRDLISADGRLELLPTVKDLAGLPRIVMAQRK